MSQLRLLIALLAIAGGTGCVTKYGAKGFTGGYYETPTGQEGTIKVWFAGNAYTDQSTVELYLLYRCAEYAESKGADYFAVDETSTGATLGAYQSSGHSTTTYYGNTASTTYTLPTTTYYQKYTSWAVIRLLPKKPKSSSSSVYATERVLKDLRPYIQRPMSPCMQQYCCIVP